jgi:hypothetical protein
VGVLEASYRKAGARFYYGVDNDPLGCPGLVAIYDAANMTVDAEGTTALGSVWFDSFAPLTRPVACAPRNLSRVAIAARL